MNESGESAPLCLRLNDVDVRQALELVSRSHATSILIAPGVTGRVTANLEGLSGDQAIQAILRLCGLVAIHEDGLTYVYAPEDYPRRNRQVRVYPLDYLSAQQVMPALQGLLSPVGECSAVETDPSDNSRTREAVIVSDAPEVLAQVEAYVQEMDQRPPQVMIEAHVLEVKLSDECDHGINYDYVFQMAGSDLEFDITGFADPLASPAVFARIKGTDINNLLQILKTTTDAKTLASPRVMVVNGQKARIQVGEQLGYKVVTVTETAAVEEVKFLEVGVVLEVTPRISRDNRVLMRVKPEVSKGVINPDTLLPEEETSEVESDVLLSDGQGLVIGGLIQEECTDIQQKLPFLGDLYLIGWLFQKRHAVKERREIIITLVPRICQDDPEQLERNDIDTNKCLTPLFQGPLHYMPRPWDPCLPDAIHNPHHLYSPFQCLHGCRSECTHKPVQTFPDGNEGWYEETDVPPVYTE